MCDYKIDSEKIHMMEEQLEKVAADLVMPASEGDDAEAEMVRVFVQSVITDLKRWDAGPITPPAEITLACRALSKAQHIISEHLLLVNADADELGRIAEEALQALEEDEHEANHAAMIEE